MLTLTCFPPHSLTDAGIQTQVACKEQAARHSVLSASSSPKFEPGRAPTRLASPRLGTDEKSNTPISNLDNHNIVNWYGYLFYCVIYLNVDLFSRSYCRSIQIPGRVVCLRVLMSFRPCPQHRAPKNFFSSTYSSTRCSQVPAHTDHDGGYMGQLLTMGFMVHSIDDQLYPYYRPMPLFPSGLFLFILYNFG